MALRVEPARGTAWLDPLRIRQALDNLIDNAVRHATGAEAVSLAATQRRSTLTLTVSDDGRGLDGTPQYGLGLRIVAAIAASHGGTFQLADRPDGGVLAALTLPVAGREPCPTGSSQRSGMLEK
jgi:signal transduction histidine kinase